jgi:hypothetical protein
VSNDVTLVACGILLPLCVSIRRHGVVALRKFGGHSSSKKHTIDSMDSSSHGSRHG